MEICAGWVVGCVKRTLWCAAVSALRRHGAECMSTKCDACASHTVEDARMPQLLVRRPQGLWGVSAVSCVVCLMHAWHYLQLIDGMCHSPSACSPPTLLQAVGLGQPSCSPGRHQSDAGPVGRAASLSSRHPPPRCGLLSSMLHRACRDLGHMYLLTVER